ncbi:hypothetical protein QYE76_023321 [Lolium multiflorum]|uniref:Uncharacterized protein n=1 Tax=Lolium multiflorum TaxID=4521 RepID=A0AAD8RE87_LOLMU|nr:hypothetical protein QYE76_023321 [Lolium multiflorum]
MSQSPAGASEKDKNKDDTSSGAKAPPPQRRTSTSPTPRRGRSLVCRDGTELVVRERVIREGGGTAQFPTLTRSNYAEWATVMRIQL